MAQLTLGWEMFDDVEGKSCKLSDVTDGTYSTVLWQRAWLVLGRQVQ